MLEKFEKDLKQFIELKQEIKYVFLCIGTNKVIGDCFGPMVGTNLKFLFRNDLRFRNVEVIGNNRDIICGTNAKEKTKHLNLKKKKQYIIAIDAALASKEEVGKLYVENEKMILGKALEKNILKIGDVSIKGVVGENFNNPIKNYQELKKASYKQISNMAKITAKGIFNIIKTE